MHHRRLLIGTYSVAVIGLLTSYENHISFTCIINAIAARAYLQDGLHRPHIAHTRRIITTRMGEDLHLFTHCNSLRGIITGITSLHHNHGAFEQYKCENVAS